MDENELIRSALKEAAFIVFIGIVVIAALEAWGV